MKVSDVFPAITDDTRVFILSCHVVEIHQQLHIRVADVPDKFQTFAGGIDDVALLLAQRLDDNSDPAGFSFGGYPAAKAHELLKRHFLGKTIGDLTRPAAAENDDADAQPHHRLRQRRGASGNDDADAQPRGAIECPSDVGHSIAPRGWASAS